MFGIKSIALLLMPIACLGKSVTIPNVLHDGPVTPEAVSSHNGLDMPKLRPGVNDSSYDWWYFDVVSHNAKSSVTIVFYDSGPHGFINSFEGGPLSVSISGIFPNGSLYDVTARASGAVVSRKSNSFATSAVFKGTGINFEGFELPHDEVLYVVNVDAPHLGVEGTVTLKSKAPAHYPCGPNTGRATEEIIPHVFWSNAIPDAAAKVDLRIGDTRLDFVGSGYHDKNWGDIPFLSSTQFWYWGHASLGPYSIVWFDATDSAGVRHTSGYISKHGKILLSSCSHNSVSVKPWGANDTYPPTISTGVMQGVEVTFDLGHGKKFWANVTTAAVAVDVGLYVRTTGTVVGGLHGCSERFKGPALFEEFKIIS